MNLDVLAIGAHPDDCEMFMGGSLLAFKARGLAVGVCDLTRGEKSTYGDVPTRLAERDRATRLLALDARTTLALPDGGLANLPEQRLAVIQALRELRPRLVFTFAFETRHPDHRACAEIVRDACFFSGLEKLPTPGQEPHRPEALLHFMEHTLLEKPDFCVDISAHWEAKGRLIEAYESQVLPKGTRDDATKTFIRSEDFWRVTEARAALTGNLIGVAYAEGFLGGPPPRLADPLAAFARPRTP